MDHIIIAAPRISDSARALAGAVNLEIDNTCRYVRSNNPNSNNRRATNLLVNWGIGNVDNVRRFKNSNRTQVLNLNTSIATNKRTAFERFRAERIPHPPFCTTATEAHEMIHHGNPVYCRTELRGHSGTDIVVARNVDQLVPAPLYTQGIDKHHEFRFHVMGGVVIDGVRKAFRTEIPEAERNRDVMNHAAGTIFVRSGPALERAKQNEAMLADCVRAVNAVGLDFGAVDVMTDRQGQHYILEVNTAPGLVETTLERYKNAVHSVYLGRSPTPWSQLNSQTQTQTENQEVNTMQVQVSNSFSGTSLIPGRVYQAVPNADGTVSIRNEQGRLRTYSMTNLISVPNGVPVAPDVPSSTPEPSTELPTGFDVTSANNSPMRVVTLSDGSLANPGGTVVYSGSGSSVLRTGQTYTVAEVRKVVDQDVFFLGININGSVRRWNSRNFTEGNRVAAGSQPASPSAPTATQAPELVRVLDASSNQLEVGNRIRVVTGHGGHGLPANSLATIRSINHENNTLSVEPLGGENRANISARRVVKIDQQTYDNAIRARQLSETNNQVVSITLPGSGQAYRIRESNLQVLRDLISRLSI